MGSRSLTHGLLTKRKELSRENANLRERMAILSNNIKVLNRVLEACGFRGSLEGFKPRAARIVLFYPSELRE